MNRILTDLRNRLTTEHLKQFKKILVEGPSDLDNHLEDLIIDSWKSKRFNLDLFFSFEVFFRVVLVTEEKSGCVAKK
jgi:hypothetical protein